MIMFDKFLDLEQENGGKSKDILLIWRKRIFLSIFISALVASCIPFFLNVQIAITSGKIPNAVTISLIYIAAIFVTFGKFIPFKTRAWSGLLLFYLMGVFSLATIGPVGGGRMFLFAFAVLTTLILGLRAGIIALTLNVLTMVLWVWACSNNYFSSNFAQPFSLSQIQATGFTFLFMNCVATVSLGIFVTVLKKGFEKEQNLSNELKESNERLLRENEERKRAQDALRESEAKFRLISEQSLLAIGIIQDGHIKYANEMYSRITGYSLDEIYEWEPYGYARTVYEDDLAFVMTQSKKKQAGNKDVDTNHQFKGYTKTKDIVWWDLYSRAIVYNGRPADLFALVDITERIESEKEKKTLGKQLQNAQKMESIGTLAGGIAHDFNNLLMAIQSRTSMILINKDSSHPDLEHLKGIENHVESAAGLTKQLLGFARGGKYEVKATDLNELIKKENRMFGRTKKEITIREKFEENLWPVEVDRGQIQQVLLNLYVNASQAMPGGGNLYLETENVTLDDNYVKPFSVEPGRYVKISIIDTGIGMDKATQERIFDPFFTTKEPGRGTGLGLASTYGIIKNHNGVINVYSEEGEGTTFSFYLPASAKEVVIKKKSTGHTLRGSETILFVDDEEMITEVAEDLLKLLGYKALIARSGKEAIRIYEENKKRIDMVILDMIMPDMSGGEAYDRMKDINPKVKVLLASGYSSDRRVNKILDRGCNGFIQKPFKMKELSQKLRAILDKK